MLPTSPDLEPDSPAEPTSRPLATWAFWILIALAFLSALEMIWMPLALPGLVILIVGAIGIRKRSIWSAYGLALWFGLNAIASIGIFARDDVGRSGGKLWIALAVLSLLSAGFAVLLFGAGRELSRTGGRPGKAWPWLAVATVYVLFALFFRVQVMPTASMEDTILVGDRILSRTSLFGPIHRGELVVFRFPPDPRQINLKRVVAIGGDRL